MGPPPLPKGSYSPLGSRKSPVFSLSFSLPVLPADQLSCRPLIHQISLTGFNDRHWRTKMSFQDIRNGGGRPASSSRSSTQSPSQAVAAGIFQINTAISAFRRLVEAIGTSKDTPDHRQKLSVFLLPCELWGFMNCCGRLMVVLFKICWWCRHNTRQRILQLVKDTSAKLKSLSDSDHAADVSVIPFYLFVELLF